MVWFLVQNFSEFCACLGVFFCNWNFFFYLIWIDFKWFSIFPVHRLISDEIKKLSSSNDDRHYKIWLFFGKVLVDRQSSWMMFVADVQKKKSENTSYGRQNIGYIWFFCFVLFFFYRKKIVRTTNYTHTRTHINIPSKRNAKKKIHFWNGYINSAIIHFNSNGHSLIIQKNKKKNSNTNNNNVRFSTMCDDFVKRKKIFQTFPLFTEFFCFILKICCFFWTKIQFK